MAHQSHSEEKLQYNKNVGKDPMKKRFIHVSPKTQKAKIIFNQFMHGLHSCIIDKEDGNKMFLISISQRHSFWIERGGNLDWEIIK